MKILQEMKILSENNQNLDIIELSKMLDSEDMIGFTRKFVDDFEKGVNSISVERFPWIAEIANENWNGIICLGMGGSAAGGDFLSSLSNLDGRIPIHIQRDYTMPSWWNSSWLVLATSHSGNTEEALAATEIALNAGATVIIISTGGMLAGMPEIFTRCHLVPSIGGQPPRSAFGHIFSRQLGLLREIGALPKPNRDTEQQMIDRLKEACDGFDIIKDPNGDLVELASFMSSNPIALVGPTELLPALNRFKNQLNENSARFARIGVIPEMNHNESVAWGGVGGDKDPDADQQVLLFLTWDGMHDRVSDRIDWMVAHTTTDYAWKMHGEGSTLLESLLHLCIVMDWISIALALMHGKDPAAIGPISALKDFLNSKN
jgi:glucose/mannose-6-phosphate isomerase|tara:strand:- start:12541 stop:13665 length:1125 start_codon:yes stop_codon:yes gene_type:complete